MTVSRYHSGMSPMALARHVSPWTLKRDRARQQRIAALRQRDGDDCRRCRRPISFDLPPGHDKGPSVQPILTLADGEPQPLDNLCLCHQRCNAAGADHTDEVTERIRRKAEAALLSSSRAQRRRKAALS